MKTLLKLFSILAFAVLFTADTSIAQERGPGNGASPNAMVSQTISNKSTITVTYARPGLKGREMSSLAPSNKVWRTGANESTAITFSTDVMVGGDKIEAGTYSLYTIPGENWTFIINKKLSWGTQYDASQDVARFMAAMTTTDAPFMERFAIYFDELTDTKTHLNLHWGTTKTAIPITIE